MRAARRAHSTATRVITTTRLSEELVLTQWVFRRESSESILCYLVGIYTTGEPNKYKLYSIYYKVLVMCMMTCTATRIDVSSGMFYQPTCQLCAQHVIDYVGHVSYISIISTLPLTKCTHN